MKAKRTFLIIILFLVAGMAGCSPSMNQNDNHSSKGIKSEEENQSPEVVKLTFWRNAGNSAENRVYEQLIAGFQKENPTIKVEMAAIPFREYELKLRTELAAGDNPPDVMTIDSPNLAAYANAGVIRSIDAYMKIQGGIDDIPETVLSGMKYNNEIYLAPISESSTAMFYNKNLFKEKGIPFPSEDPDNPWTWEQVLEAAQKLNDPANGIYGIDPGKGFGEGEGPAYFKMPLLWQFGAEILSPDGTTADGYLNSPKALEALQFYQDLYHKYKVAAVELPPDPFVSGKLGISIEGSWALGHYTNNFPNFKLGEDYGIAPLPKNEQQAAPNGGWALGISAKTVHPEEAWQFIKYLISYEGIKKYVSATGDLPARYSVAEDFPELNEYPKNIFLVQSQKYSINRPATPVYTVVSTTIRELFEEVGIAKVDVKVAADRAVRKIDQAIQQMEEKQ